MDRTFLGILLAIGCVLIQKYALDPPPVGGSKVGEHPASQSGSATKPAASGQAKQATPNRLWTVEELAKHVGSDPAFPPHLAVLGEVFDVSRKMHVYGPGGSYAFFCGKDGSRAFATGQFNPQGLVPSLEGLTASEVAGVEEWANTYKRDYTPAGKVVGHFYDAEGNPTAALWKARELLRQNKAAEDNAAEQKKLYPPCNLQFSQESGRTLWCEPKSGGIIRDWAGYPRQRVAPGQSDRQCVCVQESQFADPTLREYEGCASKSPRCDWDKDNNPVVRGV